MVAASTILSPISIMLFCFESYANLPTKAAISETDNTVRIIHTYYNGSRLISRSRQAQRNSIVSAEIDEVNIPGDNESATKVNFYNEGGAMGLIGEFGPSNQETKYRFACRTTIGKIGLNWGVRINRGACDKGVSIGSSSRKYGLINTPFTQLYSVFSKTLDLADNSSHNNIIRYCGAASDRESGWNFSISQANWVDLFSPNLSPCEEAVQLCESNTNSECFAINQGEWAIDSSKLTASLRCDNDRSFARSNLKGLDVESSLRALKNEAIAEADAIGNSTTCAITVIGEDEVIAQPYGNEATRIKANGTEAQITIDVLAGSVFVRSAADPEGKLLLKGEVYTYNISNQTSSIIFSNTNTTSLDCADFQIPEDSEADKIAFDDICRQVNNAQTLPSWKKYPILPQQSQIGLLPKQINTLESEYASIHLPPDWVEGSGDYDFVDYDFVDYDFVASNNSAAPETGASLNNSRKVSISRIALGEFQNNPVLNGLDNQLQQNSATRVQGNLTLDELTNQLQQNGAETVRRINLADGEGIEATSSKASTTTEINYISFPDKTLAYYLIQGDYLYIILLEVYGEEYQQEESYQEMRKIAQSFRLTSVPQGPSSVPQGPSSVPQGPSSVPQWPSSVPQGPF